MSNEKIIWKFLKRAGLSDAGTAGLMGNLFAESALSPINLQNTYNNSLGYSDEGYTQAVDDKRYKNFIYDSAGYGLAQWTISDRKGKLYKYIKETIGNNTSIGDLNAQLQYLIKELEDDFIAVLKFLKTTNSLEQASNRVLFQFENPKVKDTSVQRARQSYGQKYFDLYANSDWWKSEEDDDDTNNEEITKPEITVINTTHNINSLPGREIKYIVIHYTAGTQSQSGAAQSTAGYFQTSGVEASSDFIVDDSTIVQYNSDLYNQYTWHCGGDKQSSYGATLHGICCNSNSIGIEVCSSNTTGLMKEPNHSSWYFTGAVIDKTIELTKYLMQAYNIDIDHVVRHFDVTGKYCPGIIGWNSVTGDESQWEAFKNKLKAQENQSVPGGGSTEEKLEVEPYAIAITVPKEQSLRCYSSFSADSEVITTKVYENSDVAVIIKEKHFDGKESWGYTGIGWIPLNYTKKITASEGIINTVLAGYNQFKYDDLNGKIIFPLEGWNNLTDGGFKFFAHDELLNLLFEIREGENANVDSSIVVSNEDFAQNLIYILENTSQSNREQCEAQIRLIFKNAANSKKTLSNSFSNIVIQTSSSNASEQISEEHILEKLETQEGKAEIVEYFQEKYNDDGWNYNVQNAPETLNFWFDFMNAEGDFGKYATKVIGNRAKAINDDKIKAIYFQETPSVLFLTPDDYEQLMDNYENYSDMTGYTFIKLQPFMESYFTISSQGKSAKDELDNLLYQHTYATDSTTLTAVPIYYLQPNTRIFVKDDNTGINGDYIVNKVTVPLQYNGTTSITATRAVERIY